MFWLVIADKALLVSHTALLLFNALGWASEKTRRAHLVTMGLTLGSWLLMGALYGVGYCVCTDLHWRVRRELGSPVEESSFVAFLLAQIGLHPSAGTITIGMAAGFLIALMLSIILNVRDRTARTLLQTRKAE